VRSSGFAEVVDQHRRRARAERSVRKLAFFTPPLPLPAITFDLLWHRRTDSHPAQKWFRELIASVAANL